MVRKRRFYKGLAIRLWLDYWTLKTASSTLGFTSTD